VGWPLLDSAFRAGAARYDRPKFRGWAGVGLGWAGVVGVPNLGVATPNFRNFKQIFSIENLFRKKVGIKIANKKRTN